MKGILGKKVGMTQVFDDRGEMIPVTVIEAGPCWVTQVKTLEKDGYSAVQLGFEEIKPSRLTRGRLGHLGQLETDEKHPRRRVLEDVPPLRYLREFRVKPDSIPQEGDLITVAVFQGRVQPKHDENVEGASDAEGTPEAEEASEAEEVSEAEEASTETAGQADRVDVIGISKGRGFAGTIKRHGFLSQPATHGQSDRERAPGSIGATTTPGRVLKGTRMSGRMGGVRVTSSNLEVVMVDPERNLLAVHGSVPGPKGGLVMVKLARKLG